jgi:hypothetical protein
VSRRSNRRAFQGAQTRRATKVLAKQKAKQWARMAAEREWNELKAKPQNKAWLDLNDGWERDRRNIHR